jgi:hypothetical protein
LSAGDWDVYAQCQCGWRERAPFGNRFHIHKTVCPDCGSDKQHWELVTGRYGVEGFETKSDREASPSGCLAVHTTTALIAVVAMIGAAVWFT